LSKASVNSLESPQSKRKLRRNSEIKLKNLNADEKSNTVPVGFTLFKRFGLLLGLIKQMITDLFWTINTFTKKLHYRPIKQLMKQVLQNWLSSWKNTLC